MGADKEETSAPHHFSCGRKGRERQEGGAAFLIAFLVNNAFFIAMYEFCSIKKIKNRITQSPYYHTKRITILLLEV